MTKHYGATLCMQPGALWMLHLPASTHVERRINRSAFGNDAATFLAELKYTPLSDVPKRTHGRRTYTVGFFRVTRGLWAYKRDEMSVSFLCRRLE